ncbi:MAG: hypothetical protein ACPGUV_03750 [Polyangiales bacterium]
MDDSLSASASGGEHQNGDSFAFAKVGPGPQPWVLFGAGQMSGDANLDLAWRNTDTGRIVIVERDGVGDTVQEVAVNPLFSGSDWGPVAAKDMDSDGISDVIWRNVFSGQFSVWYLNGSGGLKASGVGIGTTQAPGADLQFAGIQDANNDGVGDIHWRSTSTGSITTWFIDSSRNVVSQQNDVGAIIPSSSNWSLVGAMERNGDGVADYLWRWEPDGRHGAWHMNNGGTVNQIFDWVGRQYLTSGPYQVTSFGDFNGDGFGDIGWTNDTDGLYAAWTLNASGVLISVDYYVPPADPDAV